MNRFNYPLSKITSKPFKIKNTQNLGLDEVSNLMSRDKTLQKIKQLKHFYPDSEGRIIFSCGVDIWFVIDSVTTDHIVITAVQKDIILYSLFVFIAFTLLLLIIFSGLRPFAFGFIVFSLMWYGIVLIAKGMGNSKVRSKLYIIAQTLMANKAPHQTNS